MLAFIFNMGQRKNEHVHFRCLVYHLDSKEDWHYIQPMDWYC